MYTWLVYLYDIDQSFEFKRKDHEKWDIRRQKMKIDGKESLVSGKD